MTLEDIKKIIAQGESATVEFKKSTGVLKAAFETVCAFLNGEGGIVLIGVTDGGRIIGQEVSDRTCQEIAHAMSEIEPSAQSKIFITYVPVSAESDKKIIVVKVKAGQHIPYTFDSRAFQRVQSTSSKIPQHRYEQLIIERGQLNHSWEEFTAVDCTVDNLDENLIWKIVNEGVRADRLPAISLREELNQVLDNFNLTKDGQLTNAAMVVFGKKLFPRFAQCQLKMARFKGTDRREFLDSDLIYGNIFELLNRGEQFFKRHLPVAAKIVAGNFQRVETPLIPFDAIREALLNALCHNDYSVSSGSISLAIYDDRLELINEGKLLQGITIEKIKRGCSKLRNKIIAGVLYKCKYIEAWGRGIKSIIETCLEANVPVPEFEVDDIEFKITFKFPYNITTEIPISDKNTKITPLQKKILEILNSSGMAPIKDIALKLPQDIAERKLRYELSKLHKMGLIRSQGSTKGTVWLIDNNLTII